MNRVLPQEFKSFHDAFIWNLSTCYYYPDFVTQPRGISNRERLFHRFSISDPVQRVCFLKSRRTNIVFNFAEALWQLQGRTDLAYLMYYAPSFKKYSNDGQQLQGAAHGARIFGPQANGRSQWQKVVDLLSNDDPASKRAVIQVFIPEETVHSENHDVACTLSLQFVLRASQLHLCCSMRANDAYRGIVSDVFFSTLLLELLAAELGTECGRYVHCVNSMNVFKHDEPSVKRVLNEIAEQPPPPRFRIPHMPRDNNWEAIHSLAEIEERLRHDTVDDSEIKSLGLPTYWEQVALLFMAYRYVKNKLVVPPSLAKDLLPVYRYLVQQRWPCYFASDIS